MHAQTGPALTAGFALIGRPLVSCLLMNLMHFGGSGPLRVKQMDPPCLGRLQMSLEFSLSCIQMVLLEPLLIH
jgi:hypothetical protein